jgi:hypothetical protein
MSDVLTVQTALGAVGSSALLDRVQTCGAGVLGLIPCSKRILFDDMAHQTFNFVPYWHCYRISLVGEYEFVGR